MNPWVAEQTIGFRSLAGCVVTAWVGVEMALREVGSTGRPEFADSTIPFLQLTWFYAEVNGSIHRIATDQNDTNWGLCIEHGGLELPAEGQEERSIFRTRPILDLPLGLVTDITAALDRVGDLVEVTLTMRGHKIVLQAGEVYEDWDGSLSVNPPDESIPLTVAPDEELDKGR